MKKKVFVAVPTTGTISDAQVYKLRDIEKRYSDEIEFIYPKECVRRMFHDYARNAMVEEFLETDADILWFLDSDIAPPLHVLDLVTLHSDKWQAAGAPYPIFISPKEGEAQRVVFAVFNGVNGKQGMHPSLVPMQGTEFVDGLATGCLFLKREVFSQLQKPYFEFKYNAESRTITEGEDLGFCFKLKALGIRFFVDYGMVCKHYKTVCLLDVNNYAMNCANETVAAHDQAIRAELAKMIAPPQPRSKIILPGHGSPFARGNGR